MGGGNSIFFPWIASASPQQPPEKRQTQYLSRNIGNLTMFLQSPYEAFTKPLCVRTL
jgi:hypothetical protein